MLELVLTTRRWETEDRFHLFWHRQYPFRRYSVAELVEFLYAQLTLFKIYSQAVLLQERKNLPQVHEVFLS